MAPWISTISRNKGPVFLGVGALLLVNYWLSVVRPRQMNCAPGDLCHLDSPSMRFNRNVFWFSVAIYLSAVTFTYAAIWWVRVQA